MTALLRHHITTLRLRPDGRLTAPVGVVNINCSREGLLNGERVNLFVPVIAPLRFLLAELLIRWRRPSGIASGVVTAGAGGKKDVISTEKQNPGATKREDA